MHLVLVATMKNTGACTATPEVSKPRTFWPLPVQIRGPWLGTLAHVRCRISEMTKQTLLVLLVHTSQTNVGTATVHV